MTNEYEEALNERSYNVINWLEDNWETVDRALRIAALLDKEFLDMVEAGEKARQGEWRTDYTQNIWGGDWADDDPELLYTPHHKEKNSEFITAAANLRPKIQQIKLILEEKNDH